MKNLIIRRGKYYFEGIEYNEFQISNLIKLIGKRANLIVLDENVFTTLYKIPKTEIAKAIMAYRDEYIIDDIDTLIHSVYYKKKGILIVYSIKNGKVISKIAENLSYIKVKPIQFVITKYLMQKIKTKTFYLIFKVEDLNYVLYVEESKIIKSFTDKEKDNCVKWIIKEDDVRDLIVSEDISIEDEDFEHIKFNLRKIKLGDFYSKLFRIK